MKSVGFMALIAFLTVAFCLGFKPHGAFADSHTDEVTTDNNDGKFGIGFHSAFPLSGISGKYWLQSGIGLQGFLMRAGFAVPTQDISASMTMTGGRFLFTVQKKSRTRLYLGSGVIYTDAGAYEYGDEVAGGSGLGLEGVVGVEYSFSDLPNLGFAFEFGIKLLRLKEDEEYQRDELNIHFTTSGMVGIHYYF